MNKREIFTLLFIIMAFITACEEDTAVVVVDRCSLEPDVGPCEAYIPKYYYDKEEKECKEFIWGGCEGTVPFDTLEECQECPVNR